MNKSKIFLMVFMGLVSSTLISCGDDEEDVPEVVNNLPSDNNNNQNPQDNQNPQNDNSEQIIGGKVLDGHHYVDLGLSVKWAQCNIGALKPEQYGKYFAWGETASKKTYSWSNYKYCEGTDVTITKYNKSSNEGLVDDLDKLEKEDDAAVVNWGGAWRMPTKEECQELIDGTNNYWTDNYKSTNIAGYVFCSKDEKYASDTLFIPAAGYKLENYSYDVNTWGNYWMATGEGSWVPLFCFWVRSVYMNLFERSAGYTIRPVAD